ncbi:MAG: hypothetical protein JWR19_4165 [Pedosphaera sp.]|nr:hypothetical protein [Pedosphaera sp.]
MIQIPTFGDERQLAACAFCGGNTGTRDHCPSRVLLDEPYPDNLPVVPACAVCNAGFSADEEYLACLLACVLAGSTDPSKIARPKICRILTDSPALRARLERAKVESPDGILFVPEDQRVSTVVTKLAKGHALFELHEPCPEPPDLIRFAPITLMSESERNAFECLTSPTPCFGGWPEVGSRAMQRLLAGDEPWLVVQNGLYRFRASNDSRASIRIVINEYLACHVRWD